jgi:hypothetical protein
LDASLMITIQMATPQDFMIQPIWQKINRGLIHRWCHGSKDNRFASNTSVALRAIIISYFIPLLIASHVLLGKKIRFGSNASANVRLLQTFAPVG